MPLEPSWSLLVHLDASKEALGDHLGAIWVPFGRHFAHFGFILNDVGSILGSFFDPSIDLLLVHCTLAM